MSGPNFQSEPINTSDTSLAPTKEPLAAPEDEAEAEPIELPIEEGDFDAQPR